MVRCHRRSPINRIELRGHGIVNAFIYWPADRARSRADGHARRNRSGIPRRRPEEITRQS
jgi:hypothetical protein